MENTDTVRARELGVPFTGTPGPLNAITDVKGLEVGQVTLIEGNGALDVGKGPIRTGVTAILPRGKDSTSPVFGGWFTLNGSGEMTGTTWIEERGLIDGPILITNTHSVGVVRDAAVSWMVDKGWAADWHAPVVAESEVRDLVGELGGELKIALPQAVVSEEFADLLYDFAFRVGYLRDSRLLAIELFRARIVMCASPEYLQRRGVPSGLRDRTDHILLVPSYHYLQPETGRV